MKTAKLVKHLESRCEADRLMLQIPGLQMSFADDNMHQLRQAVSQLRVPTPINIRQFTAVETASGVPVKKIVVGILTKSEVRFLSAAETRDCYETDSRTGAKLPPQPDYEYVEVSQLLPGLFAPA